MTGPSQEEPLVQ